MYARGEGTQKDDGKALLFLESLALEGDPEAQVLTGALRLAGRGWAEDASEAARWFSIAAEQNYAPALELMAAVYHEGIGVKKKK